MTGGHFVKWKLFTCRKNTEIVGTIGGTNGFPWLAISHRDIPMKAGFNHQEKTVKAKKCTAIKRAVGTEQKEIKRRAILDAALSLFEESEGELATVADVAKRADIAKGTVYLYFRTREEIYMTLLEDFINRWISFLEDLARPDGEKTVSALVSRICIYIEEKPAFMKLASIFNGILEKNIDFETAYACKVNLRERVIAAARIISGLVPGLSPDLAARMILRSFALSIGLWQIAEPAPILKKVLEKEELSLLKIDFQSELKESLTILWEGAYNKLT
jgi:AcrR family transcriptional regulator